MTPVVVIQSRPDACLVCAGEGRVRLKLIGRDLPSVDVDCLHCDGAVPLVLLPPRRDVTKGT